MAAGDAALAEALPPVHGEVRTLLVSIDTPAALRGCVSGAPRPARHGRDRDRGRARTQRAHRRDVPRGDAADERAREEARGAPALGSCANRDRGRRPARAGGREGHRQAHASRRDPHRVRRAGTDRRPARPRAQRRGARRHGAVDGTDPRARGVAVSGTLLAIDGDSFAHRAYHSMPKSVRLNAVVGFGNMVSQLWKQEQPDAVLVGWDTLEVPTYRHEAYAPYQSGRVFEDSIVEQLAILPQRSEEHTSELQSLRHLV